MIPHVSGPRRPCVFCDDDVPHTHSPSRPQGVGCGAPLFAFLAAVAFALFVTLVHGCGASALAAHATTAHVAMVAVIEADAVYVEHLDASLGSCHGDDACMTSVNAAHLPAESAIELTRIAILNYAAAIGLALAADESGDALGAAVAAAIQRVWLWAPLAAALQPRGIDVPALPGGAR